MQFERGKFLEYRATTKIHSGQEGIDIHQDDIFEFDGQTLNYGGQTYQVPTIRSAIKAGWFVLATDTDTTYVPKSASISIRSANTDEKKQMSVKTVQNEERVVGTVVETKTATATAQENDGSIVSSKIKTAAKQKTVLSGNTNVDQEISDLENTTVKSSKYKVVRQEDQEISTPKFENSVDGAVVAGKIKTPAKQKISLDGTNKSFDDVYKPEKAEIFKVAKATGDVETPITGEEITDLLPDAAVAAKPPAIPVEWDLKVHWKTRVKNAVALHAADRDAFHKVLAMETKSVKKRIQDALSS